MNVIHLVVFLINLTSVPRCSVLLEAEAEARESRNSFLLYLEHAFVYVLLTYTSRYLVLWRIPIQDTT